MCPVSRLVALVTDDERACAMGVGVIGFGPAAVATPAYVWIFYLTCLSRGRDLPVHVPGLSAGNPRLDAGGCSTPPPKWGNDRPLLQPIFLPVLTGYAVGGTDPCRFPLLRWVGPCPNLGTRRRLYFSPASRGILVLGCRRGIYGLHLLLQPSIKVGLLVYPNFQAKPPRYGWGSGRRS